MTRVEETKTGRIVVKNKPVKLSSVLLLERLLVKVREKKGEVSHNDEVVVIA